MSVNTKIGMFATIHPKQEYVGAAACWHQMLVGVHPLFLSSFAAKQRDKFDFNVFDCINFFS